MIHTPGPWYIGSEHDTDYTTSPLYEYDTAGWPYFVGIKEERLGKSDYHPAIGIQNEADARLIAAAPDGLELAKMLKSYLEETLLPLSVHDIRRENRHQACLAACNNFISKATGQ